MLAQPHHHLQIQPTKPNQWKSCTLLFSPPCLRFIVCRFLSIRLRKKRSLFATLFVELNPASGGLCRSSLVSHVLLCSCWSAFNIWYRCANRDAADPTGLAEGALPPAVGSLLLPPPLICVCCSCGRGCGGLSISVDWFGCR